MFAETMMETYLELFITISHLQEQRWPSEGPICQGYPAKRALPAMLAHGRYGPFGRIPLMYTRPVLEYLIPTLESQAWPQNNVPEGSAWGYQSN